MKRKLLLIMTLLLLAGMLALSSGCGIVENLQLFKGSNDSDTNGDDTTPTVVENGLTVTPQTDTTDSTDNNGTDNTDNKASTDDTQSTATLPEELSGETTQVILYFVSADGTSLEAETRSIPKQEGVARATVNQLISGPQKDDLSATLPSSVTLRDINISDGICTVDFSSELLTDIGDDAQTQLLALYSIVNTLTQFDSVDYVQILVNGQTVSSSFGGIDVSTALAPVSDF